MDKVLTKELVDALFEYRDGVLYWKVANNNLIKVGTAAGNINPTDGRLRTQINGKQFGNHRIIYLMHHGYLPQFIDHIDGNRLNNRIENLRPATISQNNCNARLRSDNQSGIKGVSWNKRDNKWVAKLQVAGKYKHIGYYDDIEQAKQAVMAARCALHGEYARHA